ncbi:MAG: hypothetical protein JRI97_13280, partial [Deltaproteobacteria bacterium]|nr:hypothetical protein [Deltaproteobacteria bacterium]
SGAAPRYAYFFSDRENADIFCAMPDRPMVIKAVEWEDGVYNLSTCYAGSGLSFTEMRELQLEKIKAEARSRNIELCSDLAWGVARGGTEPPEDEAEKPSRPAKAKKRPYRGGARHWRSYLEDWEAE